MKTTRLTTSLVVGTPEHDWYYAMNERQRGFAVHQALAMYHQAMTDGQTPMFSAAPASPAAIVMAAPVIPAPILSAAQELEMAPQEEIEVADELKVEPVAAQAEAVHAAPESLIDDFY